MKVVSRGYRIAYEVDGDGPPLVLLPGRCASGRWWFDYGYVDALRGRYMLVLVDPLGYGVSDKPHDAAAYRAAELAADTVAVLDAEGIAAAHLWGYSRGADLAADVAAEFPERVRSVVAGGNALIWPRSLGIDEPELAALEAGDWTAVWEVARIAVPDETRERMERENDPRSDAAATRGFYGSGDLDPERVQCPTMLYSGGGEATPWDWFRDAAERFDARLERIGDYDHTAMFEQAHEVIPLVVDFLADVDHR